jgi:hypothetical protein
MLGASWQMLTGTRKQLFRPFRATEYFWDEFPRRCPGPDCFGLSGRKAQPGGQTGWKTCPTGQKIRAVGKGFLRFEGVWRAATRGIYWKNSDFDRRFSSFRIWKRGAIFALTISRFVE